MKIIERRNFNEVFSRLQLAQNWADYEAIVAELPVRKTTKRVWQFLEHIVRPVEVGQRRKLNCCQKDFIASNFSSDSITMLMKNNAIVELHPVKVDDKVVGWSVMTNKPTKVFNYEVIDQIDVKVIAQDFIALDDLTRFKPKADKDGLYHKLDRFTYDWNVISREEAEEETLAHQKEYIYCL